jgi:hypothetical protein
VRDGLVRFLVLFPSPSFERFLALLCASTNISTIQTASTLASTRPSPSALVSSLDWCVSLTLFLSSLRGKKLTKCSPQVGITPGAGFVGAPAALASGCVSALACNVRLSRSCFPPLDLHLHSSYSTPLVSRSSSRSTMLLTRASSLYRRLVLDSF